MKTIFLTALSMLLTASVALADWKTDPIWYDGLAEKATYKASRVIYGEPREYEAVFFTNKEQHDTKTLTKENGSQTTVEVFKHNQIEVVPTPNYDYKFIATSHFTTDDLLLTRLDVSSQEFCGASFKQYLQNRNRNNGPFWTYFGFSYMPEAGRVEKTIEGGDRPVVPFNGLPLYLRGYDFESRQPLNIAMLPDQKSNRATEPDPVLATVVFGGENDDSYDLNLLVNGVVYGTYSFAKDRQHVMLSYSGADGLKYELTSFERVNYWTIKP